MPTRTCLVGFIQENRASWDEMVAFKDDVRVRPQTTEICMRVRAGKGLTVTAFSDISVDATRIVPVWNGASWVEQPTSKAVWAFCDLVRAEYGLDQPDGVDADKALTYANLLPAFDTYDGQLPEVASFWEAAAEVLQPLRADPVKVGAVHTFVRDESRAQPRHVLTRRQIVRDSGGATYRPKVEGSDIIVEFDRDGDPKRPDEVRYAYGPQTRTPKRYKVAGIRDGAHAQKHAAWLALVAVFRGAERRITTEWDGRLVFPGDHILSDLWFFRDKQAYGVAARTGTVLQLDVTANVPATWGYAAIRTRVGREWGILRARGVGPRGLELHPDDVPALEAKTGLSLASVLATDAQDPTTVVLGDLTELQESYVARSAVPSDADHVQIEMVRDDIRIWQILGETVYQPAPVNDDGLDEPLVPQISVLHARCDRIETGIEVIWGVSITRGARNYEVDISYDQGTTWDVLSPFGPAATGRAQMRQIDGPVSVRARAYGRTGLHGDDVTTTFTTVAPVVDGAQVGIVNLPPIDYAGLADDVRAKIDHILTVEAQANAKASDLLARVLSAAAVGDVNTASIYNESQTRLGADTALAGDLSAAVVRIGAAEAGAITERSARIDGDTIQAQRTDAVIVRTAATEAFGLSEQTARVNADGALSSRLDVVSASAGSNASAIVAERQARADAISAEAARTEGLRADVVNGFNSLSAGLSQESQVRAANDAVFAGQATDLYARSDAGTAVGRFSMQAVSGPSGVSARIQALLATQMGGQTRGAGYYLDLMADGTSRFVIDANAFYITSNGQTAPAFSFDGYTLTIPSLRVTNSVFLPNSVSQSGWSLTADTNKDFTIGVRSGNSKIKIFVQFDGNPSAAFTSGTQLGRLQILRDGNVIRDIPINYYANGSPVRFYSLQTSGFVVDNPGGGSHTYTVRNTGNQGPISYMYEEITA